MNKAKILFFFFLPWSLLASDFNAELQWSLCENATESFKKLHIPVITNEKSDQYYFETSDFALLNKGIQIRLRIKNSQITSTLKYNFQNIQQIPSSLLNDPETTCEFDVHSNYEKIGCKTKSKRKTLTEPLSENQTQILHLLFPQLSINDLKIKGPYIFEEWEGLLEDGSVFHVDALSAPTQEAYFEISQRFPGNSRQERYTILTRLFQVNNLMICPNHQNRTRLVLQSEKTFNKF